MSTLAIIALLVISVFLIGGSISAEQPTAAPTAIVFSSIDATPIGSIASNNLLITGDTSSSATSFPLVSIAFVLPHQNLTNAKIREQLRPFFLQMRTSPVAAFYGPTQSSSFTKLPLKFLPRFQVNPVYTSGLSVAETTKKVFCSTAARGLNAVLVIIDRKVQSDDECQLSNFVTTLANDVGVPSMLWSSAAHHIEDMTANGGEGSRNRLVLLAPSMREQAVAIADFLKAHTFRVCALVVALQTPGAADFMRLLLEVAEKDGNRASAQRADYHEEHFRSRIAHTVKLPGGRISAPSKWRKLVRNELQFIRDSTRARVIVLWSNVEEANEIFSEARILGMTAETYLWLGGKPLIGENVEHQLPSASTSSSRRLNTNIVPGTVVASYETSYEAQLEVIKAATDLWTRAVRRLASLPGLANATDLAPSDLCADGKPKSWRFRNLFYRYLKEAKREAINDYPPGAPPVGRTVVFSFLDNGLRWRRLGNWTTTVGFVANVSNYKHWTLIRGGTRHPDRSVFLNIVTLEEDPYVIYSQPDPVTGLCANNGVPCELSPFRAAQHAPVEFEQHDNYTATDTRPHHATGNASHATCCSGLCIDLLQRLAIDIGFKYHIFEVRDRKWGGIDKITGEWNGLVRALLDEEADLVLTSLKINQERSKAIDFTLPFLETGITIMVAVRPGAISPYALLEPFSPSAWFAILFGCVSAVVLSSFFFESASFRGKLNFWSRPSDPSQRQEKLVYTVAAAIWLVLAMLFKAAVKVDLPETLGAKLLICVWAMFCVIFSSSYMANLAVFMITKDDFYDFTGMEDVRLKNPHTKNPPYKFGTISSGATEAFIKQNYPVIYDYMKQFNQTSASSGIAALKKGQLDAFIYDATVLEYKSSHDAECQLSVVGKWYAMTGYGIGFPHGSTWLPIFEKYIIEYQYNGFLQRLSEYWLSGVCKYRKQAESIKSFQLGILNFTSAFVLLLMGLAICFMILIAEYFISKYLLGYIIRKRLERAEQEQTTEGAAAIDKETSKDKSMSSLSKFIKEGNALISMSRRRGISGEASTTQVGGGGGGGGGGIGSKQKDGSGLFSGMFYNAMTVKCKNCGGRGHISTVCSSHPDTHLLLAGITDKSKSKQQQQQQQQASSSGAGFRVGTSVSVASNVVRPPAPMRLMSS